MAAILDFGRQFDFFAWGLLLFSMSYNNLLTCKISCFLLEVNNYVTNFSDYNSYS